jgi:hypothetical protein
VLQAVRSPAQQRERDVTTLEPRRILFSLSAWLGSGFQIPGLGLETSLRASEGRKSPLARAGSSPGFQQAGGARSGRRSLKEIARVRRVADRPDRVVSVPLRARLGSGEASVVPGSLMHPTADWTTVWAEQQSPRLPGLDGCGLEVRS